MEPHTPAQSDRLHRRDFLKAGTAAGLGLTLGSTLSARPPLSGTAKSCIFLMLTGGPSQLDTWDPKPSASNAIRGPFRPIATRVPGIHLSELFPKMAALADKFALVRSLHHTAAPIHENGFQLLNTGRLYRDGPPWPNVGAVAGRLGGRTWWLMPDAKVNTGVAVDHGQTAGFFGNGHGPIESSYEPQRSFVVHCQIARQYVEMTGSAFVTINMFPTVFDAVSWDCHADGGSLATDLGDYRDTVAPLFDTAFASLLTDLEARGLLDQTLVVAVGEFGRTPKLNANGGRDHWPGCWTAILAGGGVQGGRVIGESDAIGAEPKDRPVTCPELVATIYHALGIPAATRMPGPDGSPVAVVEAAPVLELF
jgi:uncharacterized protein (DUF1501 family)